MSKRFTNAAAMLLCLLLGACASGPVQEQAQPAPVKVDPQAQAEFQQALLAIKRGQDDVAITQFTALSHKYPNLAGAFVNLGLLQIKKGRYEDAKQALLQATTIKPDDAIAYNHLGVVYRTLGEFTQARQAYEQAIRIKPDYAAAHLNLGILLDIYLADLRPALTHYETYLSLSNGRDEQVEKWIVDLKRRVDDTSQARGNP